METDRTETPALVLYSFSVPCAVLDADGGGGAVNQAEAAVRSWTEMWRTRATREGTQDEEGSECCGGNDDERKKAITQNEELATVITAPSPWHLRCECTVVTLEQVAL